jgi:WD40 repeat protein
MISNLLLVTWLAGLLGPTISTDTSLYDAFGDSIPRGCLARLGTVRWRSANVIRAVEFSSDGGVLAIGDSTGVSLWNVQTGRPSARAVDVAKVNCLAFTAAHKEVFSGNDKGDLCLWDAQTLRLIRRIRSGFRRVTHIACSPDGKLLAACSGQGAGSGSALIGLWSIATGQQLAMLRGHDGGVLAVAFSPLNDLLISGGDDGIVRLWSIETRHELRELRESEGPITSLVFGQGGDVICAANKQGTLLVWKTKSGKPIHRFAGSVVKVSADGRRIAATSKDGKIRVWELATGKELACSAAGRGYIFQAFALSPQGSILAWSELASIALLDVRTGIRLSDYQAHKGSITSIAFACGAHRVVTVGAEGAAHSWRSDDGRLVRVWIPKGASPAAMILSPDGEIVACGSTEVGIAANCLERSEELWKQTPAKPFTSLKLAFSGDGAILVAVMDHQRIEAFQTRTGQRLSSFDPDRGFIQSLTVSWDGKLLASGHLEGAEVPVSVHVWELSSGRSLVTLRGHTDLVNCLAFSRDGKLLATAAAGADSSVRIWEIATGQQVLHVHQQDPVLCLLSSPSDSVFASGTFSGSVNMCEWTTGRTLRSLSREHGGGICSLAFSPNNERLATGHLDSSALVWNIAQSNETHARQQERIEEAEVDRLWSDLSDQDAKKALNSVRSFVQSPDLAMRVFQRRLKSVKVLDTGEIAKLVALVDSDSYTIRNRATQDLESAGPQVEHVVLRALSDRPSPEAKARLEAILRNISSTTSPTCLRGIRGVQVLEHLDSSQAYDLLKVLASGSPNSPITQDALRALYRLDTVKKGKGLPVRPTPSCKPW